MRFVNLILRCFCFSNPICSSGEIVFSIDDLLIQILLCLPVRSLIRFKSVSKHWSSIITSNPSISRRNQKKNLALGVYFNSSPYYKDKNIYPYIPFSKEMPKAPFINSNIVQSVNGLMLCKSGLVPAARQYYVYNPTTNTETVINNIPWTSPRVSPCSCMLVFDPVISPHYKLLFIPGSIRIRPHENYKIWIYSSETRVWSFEGEYIRNIFESIKFDNGVYWNGSIHWLASQRYNTSLRYHVETRMLSRMPTPPYVNTNYSSTYFGETCDHLNYVELVSKELYSIYQWKNGYSKWDRKYKVDLSPLLVSYYRMINSPHNLSILSLVCGEKEDDDSLMLILAVHGMIIIKYNLVNRSFKKIHKIEGEKLYNGSKFYRYFESLSV